MATVSVERASGVRTGALLLACAAEHGSAAHPYFASEALLRGPDAGRNLADAVHFLCSLHGRHPGVIDVVAAGKLPGGASAWIAAAAAAMATERLYQTRIAVAAGPMPGTPGGSAGEAAVQAQRNALATLARSERFGCGLGAAFAFAADWHAIRSVLDIAAERLAIDPPPAPFGAPDALRALANSCVTSAGFERAFLFGAEQLSLQHRALWDLLEAREEARRGC